MVTSDISMLVLQALCMKHTHNIYVHLDWNNSPAKWEHAEIQLNWLLLTLQNLLIQNFQSQLVFGTN